MVLFCLVFSFVFWTEALCRTQPGKLFLQHFSSSFSTHIFLRIECFLHQIPLRCISMIGTASSRGCINSQRHPHPSGFHFLPPPIGWHFANAPVVLTGRAGGWPTVRIPRQSNSLLMHLFGLHGKSEEL